MEYMAFTDHCDKDYARLYKYMHVRRLDIEGYWSAVNKMKQNYPFLAVGIELGYSELAEKDYAALPLDKFDYVINSIHTVNGSDCYNKEYFCGRTKKEAYDRYLKKVLESVDASYSYDAISHLGFVRKNAPYEENDLTMAEFGDILDEIFLKIISKNKTLELNSNIKTKNYMPTKELVERYRALGGTNICFASDAHILDRVGEGYKGAAEIAKDAGFEYWTVYRNRTPQKIKIE